MVRWTRKFGNGPIGVIFSLKKLKENSVCEDKCRISGNLSLLWVSASQTFFSGGIPKIIFHIPRNPCLWKRKKWKEYKETFVSARRFLQYFSAFLQYFYSISNSRKSILAIFRGRPTFITFAVFRNSYVFITVFLVEPLMVFCGTLNVSRHLVWETLLCVIRMLHLKIISDYRWGTEKPYKTDVQ